MPTTATRLITLILMLQRQPGQKAADLAERLNVSVRTIHRYFGMLDDMGVPVYAERGPYGGFSLVRGYKLPPLVFTPEEAVAISLGANLVSEMWGDLYREAARAALTKLENVLPEEQLKEIGWAGRSLAATGLNKVDLSLLTPVLAQLRRAVRDRSQVKMTYQGGTSMQSGERAVDPYALVHRWGWWYVVGFCHLRGSLRSFRLDRIQELGLTGQTFSLPDDFDLQAYLKQESQYVPPLKVRMSFRPEYASLARMGRGYWEEMEAQADGSTIVTFFSPDVYAAASNALAYGPAVTVLDPPEVCRVVYEWADLVAGLYLKKDGMKNET